jgi:tetratricopeptide (TPR) repeat protein
LKNKGIKIALTILVLVFMIWVINLVAVRPYIAEIKYFNGMRYNVDGNYREALPYFEQAASLYPYNGRILHALGTTYYNLGDLGKAEEILRRTTKYRIDANTFYNLGLVYSQAELFSKAEEKFKYAVYLMPRFTKAYYDLGYLYFTHGKYDDTIEQWNKILEIEPNFSNKYIVLNNLGIVYNKKEMPEKALEYFLEVLALAPEGSLIIEEIEKEVYNIYKSNLEK